MVAFRPEISAIHSAVWIGRRLVVDGPTLGNMLYDTAYCPYAELCMAYALHSHSAVKAKFHYTSLFGAGSEPVRSRFGAGSEPVRS